MRPSLQLCQILTRKKLREEILLDMIRLWEGDNQFNE